MELVLVFSIVFLEVVLVHFPEIVEIIGTLWVDTFMEDEVSAFFFGNERIATVWAAQLYGRKAALIRREFCRADLTEKLPLGTVVLIEEGLWGIAARAGAALRDVTLQTASDRLDFLAVALFVIRDEVFIVPALAEVGDQREFINLELLVFRRKGIIKRPLLERDVSADKI